MSKDFFNQMAENWDSYAKHDMLKAELMVSMLDIKENDKVLDVGTGTGVLIPLLMHFTAEKNITAIDEAEKMIEVAEKKFSDTEVNFICGDVLSYPFAKASFDFIICYSMFPHFKDKVKAIEILGSYLKKGGKLAVLHSQSRDKINGVHEGASSADIREDKLPYAHIVMGYMDHCGLREELLIDDEDMYLICASKLQ